MSYALGIMSELARVREWYQKQGYSFEMESAHVCSRAGFDVQLGSFFSDPNSGKSRELDLICTRSVESPSADVCLYMHLLIQCKFLPDPWLFFSNKDHSSLPLEPSLLRDHRGDSPLYIWPDIPVPLAHGFLYGWPESAYGATTAHIEQPQKQSKGGSARMRKGDLAYEALASITAAFNGWGPPRGALLSMPDQRVYHLTVPVVFARGSLFTVHWGKDGDVFAPTNTIRVAWRGGDTCRRILIDVVEASTISGYLDNVSQTADALVKSLATTPLRLKTRTRASAKSTKN